MKIVFDLSSAQPQGAMAVNGGGEYAFTIFTKVVNTAPNNIYVIVLNKDRGINDSINTFCKKNQIEMYWFENNRELEILFEELKPNTIVFPVCYSFYYDLKIDNSVKLITIIHDLTPIWMQVLEVKFGRYLKKDGLNWLRKIRNKIRAKKELPKEIKKHKGILNINNNQTIVTVSYYSKISFELLLGLPKSITDEIKVYYTPEKLHSLEEGHLTSTYLQTHKLEKEKFFLFLASCRWTKNNAIAIFKIDELISRKIISPDYKVVVLGLDELSKKYYINKIKNHSNFIYDSYIEKNVLEELIQKSHLLVFPSILEGFGMPPIEAMKYGKAPACSTSMSIPEICGNGALYFDPFDEKSIEAALLSSFDHEWMKIKNLEAKKRFEELKFIRETGLSELVSLIIE